MSISNTDLFNLANTHHRIINGILKNRIPIFDEVHVDLEAFEQSPDFVRLDTKQSVYFVESHVYHVIYRTIGSILPDVDFLRFIRYLQKYCQSDPLAAKFVYGVDKYPDENQKTGQYRNVYDFTVTESSANDSHLTHRLLRWNGSKTGKNYQSFGLRETWKKIYRMCQHGRDDLALRCCLDGQDVEVFDTGDSIPGGGTHKFHNFFDLHHIIYSEKRSSNKNGKDPSQIIKKINKTHAEIYELLRLIPLSKVNHTKIHGYHSQDFSYWRNHWDQNKGIEPFIFTSESAYIKCCNYANAVLGTNHDFSKPGFTYQDMINNFPGFYGPITKTILNAIDTKQQAA